MVTVSLFVRLRAKPGKEAAVEAFLRSGLPLAEAGDDGVVRTAPGIVNVWHL